MVNTVLINESTFYIGGGTFCGVCPRYVKYPLPLHHTMTCTKEVYMFNNNILLQSFTRTWLRFSNGDYPEELLRNKHVVFHFGCSRDYLMDCDPCMVPQEVTWGITDKTLGHSDRLPYVLRALIRKSTLKKFDTFMEIIMDADEEYRLHFQLEE